MSAMAGSVLVLDDAHAQRSAWPALRMLDDQGRQLDWRQVLALRDEFRAPQTPEGNLGLHRDAVWLLLPLRVESGGDQWLLDIDYPPLNEVEVRLLQDGRTLGQWQLGNHQPFAARPLHGRSHTLPLKLQPGVDYELLLRVRTDSTMLVPISLIKPQVYLERELRLQLLQGVMLGLSLALLIYSLAHWASLREPIFLHYAVMLCGLTLFFASYFGIGQQYLWSRQAGAFDKIAPQAVLLAMIGGAFFVRALLGAAGELRRTNALLLALAGVSALGLMASALGHLDYRATQALATVLGPVPMLISLPAATRKAWQGDRAALLLLVGWTAYMIGALCTVGLLRGWVKVDFWTLHLFQFASAMEMLCWTRVLALRIQRVQRDGQRAAAEKEALRSLAHTDSLTGLPNRRGLTEALATALPQGSRDSAVAVYLLDLDGFKQVNDQHGHDVGDELLQAVAQRLRRTLRTSDAVARLGGDEFVVMAAGLAGEAEAMRLGHKMLAAVEPAFDIGGRHCRVGLTIGFALAPHDGSDAATLLKAADAAMYAGKQAGRQQLRRGGAAAGVVGGVVA